jgi:glycosyltransferase involved in cell wall biosynthesis
MLSSKVRSVIERANNDNEALNILTFPTHERYETQLCKTNHNFYSIYIDGGKNWNKHQTPVPENYNIFNYSKFPPHVDFDIILVQSRMTHQYEVAKRINSAIGVPIIVLEHTMPIPEMMNDNIINRINQMVGNANIYITEYSKQAWGVSKGLVIPHGIDSDTFTDKGEERKNQVLTVANDFINRDYCLNFSLWRQVIDDSISHKLVGETDGLSEPAGSVQELVDSYNECSVYFNTTKYSPIPTSLLEAMSCGCAVVSTDNCEIPEVIQNDYNGFLSNDPEELKSYLRHLISNPDKARKLGKNARDTVIEKFSENKFIDSWNTLFKTVKDIV